MSTRKAEHVPPYRRHKGTGQGYVQLDGTRHYLGRHDLPETRQRYNQLIAEWLSNGRRLPVPTNDIAIVEILDRFIAHAATYYVKPDGTPTGEQRAFPAALKPLREMYGRTPAVAFGPVQLKAVRQRMIAAAWCRNVVNKQLGRVRHVFKWAAGEGLLPITIYQTLAAIPPLKRGRCEVRESAPVRPVPDGHIAAIREHVSRQVWSLVQLQLLTGARPGELVAMRPMDLDTTGKVWTYAPATHKTEHHGQGRTIYLGPQAQAIVTESLAHRATDKPLFSPVEAEAGRRAAMRAQRKTPLSCGNRPGTHKARKPQRPPGDAYDVASYRRAIQRGCELAQIPSWHPHQLRHNAATRLRREFGIDLAQTILGHRLGSTITELYAEANVAKAIDVMSKVG